jgi:hypothetical protein
MTAAEQAFVDAVLAKCEALKNADLWAREPIVRPRAWLDNFDEADRTAAAILLDSFVYFSERSTHRLLVGAFEAATRVPRGTPRALSAASLDGAVFTPVLGETPNPTDSGYPVTRIARQALSIKQDRFVSHETAIASAVRGTMVVFLDDIAMSGDQFMATWERKVGSPATSFIDAARTKPLDVVYLCICATDDARARIEASAAGVRVYATHILDHSHTHRAIPKRQPPPVIADAMAKVDSLLDKYAPRLVFRDDQQYMTKHSSWRRLGYKDRSLLLGFENSVPDGTLPLLWADGPNGWTPLARRT